MEGIIITPILVAIEKATLLKNKIDEMSTIQYTSENPMILLNKFRPINDFFWEQLLEFRIEYISSRLEEQREGILAQVRSITNSIGELHAFLRFIDASRIGKAQSGMVLSVELLSQKYSLPQTKMLSIVRPQWKYNYKYLNILKELENILPENIPAEDLEDNNSEKTKPREIFGIVSFAGLEQNDVLSQVLLAHEIGHLLDDAYDISQIYSSADKVVGQCKIPQGKLDEIVTCRVKEEFNNFQSLTLWGSLLKHSIETLEENNIKDWIIRWIKEFTADLIAVRLVGPAFFLTLARFATSLISIDTIADNYPPLRMRLEKVINEMESEEAGLRFATFFEQHRKEFSINSEIFLKTLHEYKDLVNRPSSENGKKLNSLRIDAVSGAISAYLNKVVKRIREVVSPEKHFKLTKEIFSIVSDLHDRNIPRTQIINYDTKEMEPVSFETILNAGWLCKLRYEDAFSKQDQTSGDRIDPTSCSATLGEIYKKQLQNRNDVLSRLLGFAIEFSDVYSKYKHKRTLIHSKYPNLKSKDTSYCFDADPCRTVGTSLKGVLSGICLWDKIKANEIVISPLLELRQIKEASIDVRLGNKFIVTKRSKLSELDPATKVPELEQHIRESQEMRYVAYGDRFILHPNEFVLGSTLEYFAFPPDVTAYVIGRSSWGRIGLIIATATQVSPGYKGTLTLELANVGVVPIVLYPGVRVAQLVLHALEEPIKREQEESGRYQYSVGPQFSKVFEDEELKYRYIFSDESC